MKEETDTPSTILVGRLLQRMTTLLKIGPQCGQASTVLIEVIILGAINMPDSLFSTLEEAVRFPEINSFLSKVGHAFTCLISTPFSSNCEIPSGETAWKYTARF